MVLGGWALSYERGIPVIPGCPAPTIVQVAHTPNAVSSSSSLLLSSLELSDTKVYEPEIRARLGTAAHFCKVVVLRGSPGASGAPPPGHLWRDKWTAFTKWTTLTKRTPPTKWTTLIKWTTLTRRRLEGWTGSWEAR